MMKAFLIALAQFGIGGFSGASHNKEVLKYFDDIGQAWVDDDETAWCAAFVNWCLWKSGAKHTGSLAARSFLKWGQPVEKPQIGDVVILWRIKPTSSFGHVGFFVKETSKYVFLLGGNQSNSVNITAFSKNRVLGYRRAAGE